MTDIEEEGDTPKEEGSLEISYKFVYIPDELHEDIEETLDVWNWIY